MNRKIRKIKIKKNNQMYLFNIFKDYPTISSGRKNYKDQYTRVLKNLLLARAFNIITKKKNHILLDNIKFKESKSFLTIIFNI